MTSKELLQDLFDWQRSDNSQADCATCKTCIHRVKAQLNMYSDKIVQCCELQPSKRSNSGFKTIKTTDKACCAYEKGV